MGPLSSKYQYGFKKDFSAQNCQPEMWEKWKLSVDKRKVFDVLLTDQSKAFDCLSHESTIVKLHAYGFSLPTLKLMHNYLVEQKQRNKINQTYNSWEEILFGVLQGSILRPILFNIFLSDLFLHSHKKRKDSLETQAEPTVFSLQLEFRKFLEPSPREPAWSINKKVWETVISLK